MKKIIGLVIVSALFVSTAFAAPTSVELNLKYGGKTGVLNPTVTLKGGTCTTGCSLQMRAYVHYEGLGKTGAVVGNIKSLQFRGSKTKFSFKATMPKLLSYKGQDGKVTVQARIYDPKTKKYIYSLAVARFVICGTGRDAVSRSVWLRTLTSRLR